MNTLFDKIKERLLKLLKLTIKILLALNKWKSINNFSFQSIIKSYITRDWVKEKVLLDFKSLSSTYNNFYLADKLLKVLLNFRIEQQLFALIINNTDNNETLANFLANSLQNRLNISWLQD